MDDLVFTDPDEWDRFDAARNEMLDEFTGWLRRRRGLGGGAVQELIGFTHLAVDWKFRYSDGHLARWQCHDLVELLIDWCPRKVTMGPDDSSAIPEAVACYVEFLGDTGRLERGSDPADLLASTARGLTGEHRAAMSDPGSFGLAKSMMAAALADGVDPGDGDSLQAWVDGFNNLPVDQRQQLIPGDVGPGFGERASVPPVALPDDVEVQRSQAEAPVLRALAGLATFVGAGRKLTATGNLTLADARALVPLLGTDDVLDEQVGDQTHPVRSSGDLRGLRQLLAWAYKAGVVRRVHGKVVATKRGLALGADPAAQFDRVVDALLAIGPISSQRIPDYWLAWPDVDRVLDQLTVVLLAGPYLAAGPVPLEHLTTLALGTVNDQFEFQAPPEHIARKVEADVTDIIDTLELAGLVARHGVDEAPVASAYPSPRRTGGMVALTPAGVVSTRRLLTEAGVDAPVAGGMADLGAAEMLMAMDALGYPAMRAEVDVWLTRRSTEEAILELAGAVSSLEDLGVRSLALAVMSELDMDLAVPEVRRLVEHPDCRGLARCWLVDHEREPPAVLLDPDDPASFVDVLALRLLSEGDEGLCDTLALAGGHDAQVRTIAGMWRSPSAATEMVLAAIGEVHPAKTVAKAARKARLQRSSWQAGTGR